MTLAGILSISLSCAAQNQDSINLPEKRIPNETRNSGAVLDLSGYDMRKYGSLDGANLKSDLNFKNADLRES